jgi:HSP20 family protein
MAIVRFHGPLGGALSNIDRIRNEIDRVFSNVMEGQMPRESTGVFPSVNVYEHPEAYLVTAELPSVRCEDVEITVTEDAITLKGARKGDDGGKNAAYHRRERSSGYFSRVLALPEKINPDGVDATSQFGVLRIRLPKAEHVKPRQIKVRSAG